MVLSQRRRSARRRPWRGRALAGVEAAPRAPRRSPVRPLALRKGQRQRRRSQWDCGDDCWAGGTAAALCFFCAPEPRPSTPTARAGRKPVLAILDRVFRAARGRWRPPRPPRSGGTRRGAAAAAVVGGAGAAARFRPRHPCVLPALPTAAGGGVGRGGGRAAPSAVAAVATPRAASLGGAAAAGGAAWGGAGTAYNPAAAATAGRRGTRRATAVQPAHRGRRRRRGGARHGRRRARRGGPAGGRRPFRVGRREWRASLPVCVRLQAGADDPCRSLFLCLPGAGCCSVFWGVVHQNCRR